MKTTDNGATSEPKVNILMVDDDTSNLLALEAILGGLNQNLIKATSGAQALRHILEREFAVILLDIQMSELNGIETAVAIREREKSRHIPIIFLTGLMQTEEMVFKGYSAGAVDYLVKPIIPNVLRAKVEVFVELAVVQAKLRLEIKERTRIAAEISKLNLELEEKNRQLEERSQTLQETVSELESYSYSISHDMRAPLRAMRGYSDILLEDCRDQLSPEHQGYLQRITQSAKRLDQLIQDVLSYSQVSRSAFELTEVEVGPLLQEVISQYPGLQDSEVELIIEEPLPKVLANPALLTQCISNLLGNALKFVAPGVKPRLRIRAEAQFPETKLWFEDNGIGISPNDLERIFGIFVKVHDSKTYAGTGIGLSIVRRAVEKMGGKVGVISQMGVGSRFWLQLKEPQ